MVRSPSVDRDLRVWGLVCQGLKTKQLRAAFRANSWLPPLPDVPISGAGGHVGAGAGSESKTDVDDNAQDEEPV